ncbi:N-acetyltransferase [Saccharophagus sp. K07]|jgi:predicted GNAT family N-acyltransferase|uniref:GNAT family N-acetyltransferase n=1 Tax=Saccharophagus sp. K07 TaxID=2283636 RepID=UPI001652A84B|nr:GNAT family N-acetyltransferase [Saccharophagus sp. K07]MBC6906518.1 N-acetyltransferase [Saccharophagus sp. K07]
MTLKQIQFGSREYHDCLTLRSHVLREPLGLVLSPEDLAGEDQQYHFAAFADGALIGCVICKPIAPDRIKLRQMAVTEQMRGQGIGRALVLFAEQTVAALGFHSIELSARLPAAGFYQALGYQAKGSAFLELGVPHIKMQKQISGE